LAGGHEYPERDIWPLQRCMMEGVALWCPHNVERVLAVEYTRYNSSHYKSHTFDREQKCWVRKERAYPA